MFISLVTLMCLCGGKKYCVIFRYHTTICMYMYDAVLVRIVMASLGVRVCVCLIAEEVQCMSMSCARVNWLHDQQVYRAIFLGREVLCDCVTFLSCFSAHR